MFCAGYNESAFLQNLLRVDGYKFKKGWLILTGRRHRSFSMDPQKPTRPKKTGKA